MVRDDRPLPVALACLALVARLHGLAIDPHAVLHRLAPARAVWSTPDVLRAARLLGLRARARRCTPAELPAMPLPALCRWQGDFAILARAGAQGVLLYRPGEPRPCALETQRFQRDFDGELILVARRAGLHVAHGRFGFGWFLCAMLDYRHLLGEVLLASLFVQLMALLTPLFFQVVIDKVLVHRGLATLDVLCVGLLLVTLFEVLLAGLRGYVFAHTTNRIDVTLGARLFDHLLRLPLAYFEQRRAGDTLARVRELESIRQFLTGSALSLLLDLGFTVVFLAVMLLYSGPLTLVVLATIPLYALLAALVNPLLRARLNEKFDRGADSQALLVEAVSGIQTVKAAAVEPQIRRRWEDRLAAYVGASFAAGNLSNIAHQAAALINKLSVVLILWLGARQVIDGALSVGQLVAFNMLAGRVAGPILRLAQLWQEFQQAAISVARLGDVLNAGAEPAPLPGRGALPRIEGAIRIEDLGFRYRPDGPEILRGVSLDVAPGEIIGIVGRSGSGKSTLARLLQRLYVPQLGRVLVDGIDLRLVDPAWLRRQMGVVLQENRLFNLSVRENIALADPALPLACIVRAAKLAGAHEFILALPEGYDTPIEEQGANLSGGQRQRIAIARALATDPRILILDEATSALDYESEHILQRNMRSICQGRTVLVIAHRLSAVRLADRIIVLDRGTIVEQGSHRELLARQGHYARLHRLQSEAPAA